MTCYFIKLICRKDFHVLEIITAKYFFTSVKLQLKRNISITYLYLTQSANRVQKSYKLSFNVQECIIYLYNDFWIFQYYKLQLVRIWVPWDFIQKTTQFFFCLSSMKYSTELEWNLVAFQRVSWWMVNGISKEDNSCFNSALMKARAGIRTENPYQIARYYRYISRILILHFKILPLPKDISKLLIAH